MRALRTLLIVLVSCLSIVFGSTATALAAPADPEGGTPALRNALDQASRGYLDAKRKLAASKKRQADLVAKQKATETDAKRLSVDVDELALAAYTGDRAAMLSVAAGSRSVNQLLDRMRLIDHLSTQNERKVADLAAARRTLSEQKAKVDAEVKAQQAQEKAMAKRQADARKALDAAGSKPSAGITSAGNTKTATAKAAANLSGGCVTDPTGTGGCISRRLNHALQQARAAGFTRYTKCWRQASYGEHQKGRACDMAAAPDGFGGIASGGNKTYGNRLAQFFIANSDRLGVLYVIWFRQIWMPGNGWSSYDGDGSPSGDHTNHVHLSVE